MASRLPDFGGGRWNSPVRKKAFFKREKPKANIFGLQTASVGSGASTIGLASMSTPPPSRGRGRSSRDGVSSGGSRSPSPSGRSRSPARAPRPPSLSDLRALPPQDVKLADLRPKTALLPRTLEPASPAHVARPKTAGGRSDEPLARLLFEAAADAERRKDDAAHLESVVALARHAQAPPGPRAKTVGSLLSERAADAADNGGQDVLFRAAKESEIPNFKGSFLGRFPLVSADFWTSDHLSERSRSVDAFPGTRARGTLKLKRR